MTPLLEYESPPLHTAPPPRPGRAVAALLFCCILWGFSFPVMQLATFSFDSSALLAMKGESNLLATSATFNGWRFGSAVILYAVIVRPRPSEFTRDDLFVGLLIGLFFSVGMIFQVAGLRYALPSVSSFLTSLAVVFAPLGQLILFQKRVGTMTWLGVFLALIGILILTQPNHAGAANAMVRTPPVPYLGELLTGLGSVLFTAQILTLSSTRGARAHPVRVTFLMLAVTALTNVLTGLILSGPTLYEPRLIRSVFTNPHFVLGLAGLVFFSTLLALHLMNRFQPEVSAAVASVIYCSEPVFGTLWSVLFETEVLTRVTILGGVVILFAVLTVSWPGGNETAPDGAPVKS